ncbi:MAG TPA: c-type cytochrome [Planctomycetota bacterium]|nr:c-type cytochrome [Planctomycetota bacterium]
MTLKAATALLAAASLAGCGKSEAAAPTPARPEDRIARGKYLVETIGCSDCHTPFKMGSAGPEKDLSRYLSGHPETVRLSAPPAVPPPWFMVMDATGTAFAGPWGVSYAANLTPDVNTGLGLWTEDMFLRALREGKHWGQSRPIMPPMPWDAYRHLTDEDLKAVFAYLRSIPPVVNHVPDYQPPPTKKDE